MARALKRLDVPVVATGLTGEADGNAHRRGAHLRGDPQRLRRISAESRTSTAVVDPTSGTYTEINEWGPEVTAADLRPSPRSSTTSRGADVRARRLAPSEGADVVLRGHDPRARSSRRARRTRQRGRAAPGRRPGRAVLVSPNQREAEQLVGQELEDDDDFLMALDAIAEMGARNVLITLENGCFARLRFRKTRQVQALAPHVEPVSGVGSARDVLLAQFLAAVVDDRQPDESLRMAVAAGAASVREVGAGRFDAQVATAIANVELEDTHAVRS